MPWDCKTCGIKQQNDSIDVCVNCQAQKLSWTVQANQTRTMVISGGRRLQCLLGTTSVPFEPGHSYAKVATEATERIVAVPKERARDYAQAGKLPPPDQVFFARLSPAKLKDQPEKLTLTLTPEYELSGIEAGKVEIPQSEPPTLSGKHFDVRCLFVYGEGAVDFEFDELHVVDISEGTARGFAPKVGVEALKKKRRVFLTDPLEKGWCQRLECKQLHFNHYSNLLRPDGLPVLALALDHCAEHPTKRLLVAGHCDATGESSGYDNVGLSQRRTENICAMLRGDRKAWAASALENRAHLTEKGRPQDVKRDERMVLEWAGVPDDEGFEKFRSRYKSIKRDALNATSFAQAEAWGGVFDLYEEALKDALTPRLLTRAERTKLSSSSRPDTFEANARRAVSAHAAKAQAQLAKRRASVKFLDDARQAVGCGADYLKIKTQAKSETNRRDEFLWFDGTDEALLPWTPGAAPEPEGAPAAIYGPQGSWDYLHSDGPYTFDRVDCPPEPVVSPPEGDLLFVLDLSTSMKHRDPRRAVSRFELCREIVADMVQGLDPSQRFSMLSFDSQPRDPWRRILISASLPNVRYAIDWLSSLQHPVQGPDAGWTNTGEALERALTFKPTRILLFSDGLPTKGTVLESVVLKNFAIWNATAKVKVESYGFRVSAEDMRVDPDTAKQAVARYESEWLASPGGEKTVEARNRIAKAIAQDLKLPNWNSDLGSASGGSSLDTLMNLLLDLFMTRIAKKHGGSFHDLNRIMDMRALGTP